MKSIELTACSPCTPPAVQTSPTGLFDRYGGVRSASRISQSRAFLNEPLARAQRNGLVDMDSPVWRYPARGPGHRLVYRVMYRWGEPRAGAGFAGVVVPEPVLTRLETLHDWVAGGLPVRGGVLRWRGVAAADVSALGAAAQVNPPPADGVALDAAGPAGRHRRIYAWYLSHLCTPCL